MARNWFISIALVGLMGSNLTAELQILKDFRCMRQKGFKRCAPEQKRRMVKAGTGLGIILLLTTGTLIAVWFGIGKQIKIELPGGGDDQGVNEDKREGEEGGADRSQLTLTESVEERGAQELRRQVADQGNGVVDQDYLAELTRMLKEGDEEAGREAAGEKVELKNDPTVRTADPAPDDAADVEVDVKDTLAAWDKLNEAAKAEDAARLAAEANTAPQ